MRTLFFNGVSGRDVHWRRAVAAALTFRAHLPPGSDVRLFAMHDELPPDEVLGFARRALGERSVVVDPTVTASSRRCESLVKSPSVWPAVIYAKFLVHLAPLFGARYDRFVWFDNDMEAVRDVDMLETHPLPHGIGMVRDAGGGTWDWCMMRDGRVTADTLRRLNATGLRSEIRPGSPYYNVGLVAIEPARLPEDYSARLFRAAKAAGEIGVNLLPEQDMANLGFDVDELPSRLGSFDFTGNFEDGSTVIRHYAGSGAKPTWDRRVGEILSSSGLGTF